MKISQSLIFITMSLCLAISLTGHAKEESDRALKLAKKWQKNNGATILNPHGRVLFVYGESQPTIVCAVFALCDIAMQQGEVINTVNLGDTVRWNVNPARVGEGESMEEHLIIKPEIAGLKTSLFIATNKRSYMIELRSHENDSMGKVGFLYGGRSNGDLSGQSNGVIETAYGVSDVALLPAPPKPAPETQIITIDPTPVGEDVIAENLDFGYLIRGARVPWRPIRAYNDGVKTYIDFDQSKIKSSELPVFLVNDTNTLGGMVNYRYVKGRIIVDGLFNKASLILGVGKGKKSQKVFITRDQNNNG